MNRPNLNMGCFSLLSIKGKAMSITVPITKAAMTHGLPNPIELDLYGTRP
ncbi:hypothetical protein [Caldiplasma sukawensis]